MDTDGERPCPPQSTSSLSTAHVGSGGAWAAVRTRVWQGSSAGIAGPRALGWVLPLGWLGPPRASTQGPLGSVRLVGSRRVMGVGPGRPSPCHAHGPRVPLPRGYPGASRGRRARHPCCRSRVCLHSCPSRPAGFQRICQGLCMFFLCGI